MDAEDFELEEQAVNPRATTPPTTGTIIYVLIDPRTHEARYVGKTTISLNIRFTSHLRDKRPSWKLNWLNALRSLGLTPRIEILENLGVVANVSDWQQAERFWISYLKFIGSRLTNLTDGGEGLHGHVFTEEHRRRIGEAHKGKVISEVGRKRMSDTWKHRSYDHLRKLADSQRGKPLSDEHKAKLGKHWIGRKHTPETKAKMSAASLGKPKSPEARASMALARRRRDGL